MAVHEVVLDPDGDILVIVPGKLPKIHVEDVGSGSSGTNLNEIESPTEAPAEAPTEAPTRTLTATSTGTPTEAPVEAAVDDGKHQSNTSVLREDEEWRFRASSKHLALASTQIKTMMAGSDANETHDDGLLHWNFDGFDVDAISIILSVIHGLNRRVPRTVSLIMLAQIASVVEYLRCHEVMELYASIWVDHIGDPVPAPSREEWDCWISVAGVFQNAGIFKKWTRVAIIQSLNSTPSLELPILSQIYDVIDQRRQLHLDKIVSCVYSHIDRLSEQKTCSVECDAILLGTLIRQLRANSLPSICPLKPYEGLSLSRMVKTIRGLTVPDWYSKVNEMDEPVVNPFEFWGAPKKAAKSHHKKARMKVKKKSQPSDGWGVPVLPEEVEELEELLVAEHNCGFDALLAAVNNLESEIQGLDLENDLGIGRGE